MVINQNGPVARGNRLDALATCVDEAELIRYYIMYMEHLSVQKNCLFVCHPWIKM